MKRLTMDKKRLEKLNDNAKEQLRASRAKLDEIEQTCERYVQSLENYRKENKRLKMSFQEVG